MRKSFQRSFFSVALIISSLVLLAPSAEASPTKSVDYGITSWCRYRVTGFQDWGKAAASTRDLSSCGNLSVGMWYGTAWASWYTENWAVPTNYTKVVAGYYDWKWAQGAAADNGYVWNGFCAPNWC